MTMIVSKGPAGPAISAVDLCGRPVRVPQHGRPGFLGDGSQGVRTAVLDEHFIGIGDFEAYTSNGVAHPTAKCCGWRSSGLTGLKELRARLIAGGRLALVNAANK